MDNYFARLNQLNVSDHIEKKGPFSYLSWAWAVQQLRLADPAATWEVKRFDGLPFLRTELGYFVEVAVTVQSVTLSQIHPVLDQRNQSISEPSAFDINTSIQRCLVKAIALHGLGLYIYAGEDLPQTERPEPSAGPQAPVAPPQRTRISERQVAYLRRLLHEAGTDLERFLTYFQVDRIEDIDRSDFDRALRSLKQNGRKAA
jgi:hypothetical protein